MILCNGDPVDPEEEKNLKKFEKDFWDNIIPKDKDGNPVYNVGIDPYEVEGIGMAAQIQEGPPIYASGSGGMATKEDFEEMMRLMAQPPNAYTQSEMRKSPCDPYWQFMTEEEQQTLFLYEIPFWSGIAGTIQAQRLVDFEAEMINKYEPERVAYVKQRALTRQLKKAVRNKDYGNKQFYKKFKK